MGRCRVSAEIPPASLSAPPPPETAFLRRACATRPSAAARWSASAWRGPVRHPSAHQAEFPNREALRAPRGPSAAAGPARAGLSRANCAGASPASRAAGEQGAGASLPNSAPGTGALRGRAGRGRPAFSRTFNETRSPGRRHETARRCAGWARAQTSARHQRGHFRAGTPGQTALFPAESQIQGIGALLPRASGRGRCHRPAAEAGVHH